LLLSELDSVSDEHPISVQKEDKEITTAFGRLTFDGVNAISETSKNKIFVDADQLKYPLSIRKWSEGDLFYPLGMKGKKKLSKFFKDEKLSLVDKEKVWILFSGDDVVWVIGRRPDERFKVTDNTTTILKIEVH